MGLGVGGLIEKIKYFFLLLEHFKLFYMTLLFTLKIFETLNAIFLYYLFFHLFI